MNLIVLDLLKFDVILGINWLAIYHAMLNYYMKVVKFDPIGETSFMVQCHQSLTPCNLISTFIARRLLRKGYQGFLVLVRYVKVHAGNFESVPVVN